MLGSMSGLVSGIGTGFQAAGKLAMDALGGLWDFFNDYFIQPVKDFFGWLGDIWNSITEAASNSWVAIKESWNEFIEDPFGDFFEWAGGVWESISTAAGVAWEIVGLLWNQYVETPAIKFFDWIAGALDSTGNLFGGLWTSAGNLWNQYVETPIADAFEWMGTALDGVGTSFSNLWSSVGDIWNQKVETPIGDAFTWMITKIFDVLDAFDNAWNSVGDLWNQYVETPIAGAFEWMGNAIDGIGNSFSDAWASVSNFEWSDLLPDWSWSDIIPQPLSDFFSMDNLNAVWTGIKGIFGVFFQPIKDGINFLIDIVNDLLNWDPDYVPGGSVKNILGVSNIPRLAQGGIVDGPTLAMIGDNPSGKEAVIPLEKAGEMGFGGKGDTYNITVNASGITDRTDKRNLAREIGNMIQQEMARNIGGTTMRGRY